MRQLEIARFLRAALESSVLLAPNEPGLTHQELLDAGRRAGFQDGEINDAIPTISQAFFREPRLLPREHDMTLWPIFNPAQEPDYRNIHAFEHVTSELKTLERSHGMNNAKIDRSVIVERAVVKSIPRNDVEAAITMLVMCGLLTQKSNILEFKNKGANWPLPGEQKDSARAHGNRSPIRNEVREKAHAIVQDIIGRRTDGRSKHPEPLDEFAEIITTLGYGALRLWWIQTLAELRQTSATTSPTSTCVLAAALVEAALTCTVVHARTLGLGVFGGKRFEELPNRWGIDDLVSGAAAGGAARILDDHARQRADGLAATRQRIHVGKLLVKNPTIIPDLRPEEARDALAAAELIVRSILDWLERYPVSEPAAAINA